MANNLRIDITADASSATSSLNQASGAVHQVGEESTRTAAAMSAYNAAAGRSTAVSTSLGEAFDRASAAGATMTEAMEQAVASLNNVTPSANNAARAVGNTSNAFYAAQGASRMLAGQLPTRALERFVSGIAPLRALLLAAFPIMGMVALGEMAVEVGKKIYDAFDVGGKRAQTFQIEVDNASTSIEKQNADMQVQIDKLDAETAKIERKPINGVKMALDEAAASALELQTRLERDSAEFMNLMKNQALSGTMTQRVLGVSPGTEELQRMEREHEINLANQATAQGKLGENVRYTSELQRRYNSLLVDWGNATERNQALSALGGAGNQMRVQEFSAAAASKDIENTRLAISMMQQRNASTREYIALQNSEKDHTSALQQQEQQRMAKSAEEAARRADQQRMEEDRIQVQRARGAGESGAAPALGTTIGQSAAEADFWRSKLSTFSSGSSEYLSAETAYNAARKTLNEAETESLTKTFTTEFNAQVEAQKVQEEADKRTGEDWTRRHREQLSLLAEQTSAAERAAELSESASTRNTAFRVAMGAEKPEAAYTEQMQTSRTSEAAQVAPLQTQRAALHPEYDETEVTQAQKIEDQIKQIHEKAESERASLTQKELERENTLYQKWAGQVKGSLTGVMDAWLTGSSRMDVAWRNAANNMALSMANSLAKQATKYLEHEALVTVAHISGIGTRASLDTMANSAIFAKLLAKLGVHIGHEAAVTAAHATANATQVASDVAAAAASKVATSALNVSEVTSYTAVAAMGAAASQASIPVVGPEMATAAAAEMSALGAGYISLAAFATGVDYVPKTGVAMLHEGEGVITRDQNRAMTRAMTSGALTNNNQKALNFKYSPTYNSGTPSSATSDTRNFTRMATRAMRVSGAI
jgi:hypothetical protein